MPDMTPEQESELGITRPDKLPPERKPDEPGKPDDPKPLDSPVPPPPPTPPPPPSPKPGF